MELAGPANWTRRVYVSIDRNFLWFDVGDSAFLYPWGAELFVKAALGSD